jgi:hypothetical protein
MTMDLLLRLKEAPIPQLYVGLYTAVNRRRAEGRVGDYNLQYLKLQ